MINQCGINGDAWRYRMGLGLLGQPKSTPTFPHPFLNFNSQQVGQVIGPWMELHGYLTLNFITRHANIT